MLYYSVDGVKIDHVNGVSKRYNCSGMQVYGAL